METKQEMVARAASIAALGHKGQTRKDGTPYFSHPVRVALSIGFSLSPATMDPNTIATALMHDLCEDTDVTLEELRVIGFPGEVIAAVDALTKRDGEKYADFILRCKANKIAREVKVHDIRDNTADMSALEPDEASFLKKRYEKALAVLIDV